MLVFHFDHHSDPCETANRIYLFLPIFTFFYTTLTRINGHPGYSGDIR